MRELLFLLLVLACPLAMFFMMRGGHGHGHSHTTSIDGSDEGQVSAEELRRRRGELDRLIEEREQAEAHVASEATPLRPADGRGRPVDALSGGERERRR
jgi:Protein of unknown function (DUF2933)